MPDKETAPAAPQAELSPELLARENFGEARMLADYWKRRALTALQSLSLAQAELAAMKKPVSPDAKAGKEG